MSKYEVRKIVCDYGIYKNRELMLQLILRVKRHRNALTICDILKADDENKVLALEERKHGHWNKVSPAGIYECSNCGDDVMTADIECYKYCHHCGAIMR